MNKELLYKAVDRWGIAMQEIMVIEEMAELTKEICKSIRGRDNRVELIDEISDVTIMLEQVKIIFHIADEEINNQIDYKLKRLEEKLNK